MVRQVMALGHRVGTAVALEESERVDTGSKIEVQTVLWLIDDAAGCDQRLAWTKLGNRDLVEVQGLQGSFSWVVRALRHLGVVLVGL